MHDSMTEVVKKMVVAAPCSGRGGGVGGDVGAGGSGNDDQPQK